MVDLKVKYKECQHISPIFKEIVLKQADINQSEVGDSVQLASD